MAKGKTYFNTNNSINNTDETNYWLNAFMVVSRMSISVNTNFHSCVSHLVWIPHVWKISAKEMEAKKARGGVEIQFYSFFVLDSKWRWVVNAMPRLIYHWKTRYPWYRWLDGHGAGVVGVEYLAPTGIRSPDRLPRNESQYRLRYSGTSKWKGLS